MAKAAAAAKLRATRPDLDVALPWTASARIVAEHIADWGRDRWATGAFTYPRVGAAWAPAAWAEPLGGTVFFAGEATVTGTRLPFVHGAMASGVRAAGQVLEVFGR